MVSPDKLEILIDSIGKYSINQVIQDPLHNKFSKTNLITPYVENTSFTYWVRFSYKGDSVNDKRWVLEALDPHISLIEVYFKKDDHSFEQSKSGFALPFFQREYLHKNFIFDIPAPSSEEHVVYLKIKSNDHNVFLFKIRSSNYFSFYALNEYYLLGIFYGILGIMALYNLFLFFAVREKFYLYYVLYVVSCALISFSEDGIGFQYLWPNSPKLNPIITFYTPVFFLFCFTFYSISFLELKHNATKLYRLIWIVVFAYSVYFLFDLNLFGIRWNLPVYLVPYLLIYLAAIVTYINGFRPARFFVLGYSFILASIVVLILRMRGLVLWDNIFTVYSFNIGLVFEIVILSFALGDRFRIMKNEKEQAQKNIIEQLRINEKLKDKVNQELEEKVRERTKEINVQKEVIEAKNIELESAYDTLKEQAAEIERMNALLYAENKELQVNVKELTKARILMKDVDFPEFSKIFPDKDSCFKYLSELKWRNGYECKKCKNNKFFEGHELYARRCTKCGYDESPTTDTIFHRLRFPIVKAFYIMFLVYANKDKITSNELSQILDLRQGTCWSFSRRVLEKMNKKKKSQNADLDGWSLLVLED